MPLKLREVLELEVFQKAEPRVVAGIDQLDRQVRWVHVSELPDISYLLKGGELLLSTGLGLGTGLESQRRYIRELAEVGVAGVVVELGRSFAEFPTAMIEEAERSQLPLIALTREARFVDMTEQVHSVIINRQYDLLQRAERIGGEFTSLVLGGSSLRRIIYHLAGMVENPVVLEDTAHQVVEVASRTIPVDEALQSWDAHSRVGHELDDGRTPIETRSGGTACVWTPVALRDEEWGRIHVLEVGKQLDEIDRLALDRAGAAVGLALLADRDADHFSDRARNALISDVLEGRLESLAEFVLRARALGADLEGKRLAFVVVEPLPGSEPGVERALTERDRQRQQIESLRLARKTISAQGADALVGLQGDRVLAIVGTAPETDLREVLDEIGAGIHQHVGSRSELSAVIGCSGEIDPESLRRGYEQAKEAVKYGLITNDSSRVHHFHNLGLHQLLLALANGPELARFVESELRLLLEHDARTSTPLLPTLKTYLETNASKSSTARELHVERRTVYRRLERVSKVLGHDLDDIETRTRLIMAIRGLELLKGNR